MTTVDASAPSRGRRSPIRAWLGRAADVAWRLLVVAAALAVVGFLIRQLWFVVLPVFGALLLAAVITPVTTRLEDRGVPRLLATWMGFGGFLAILAGLGLLAVPAVVSEFEKLGPVVSEGVDDVQSWLVNGPLGLTEETVQEYRAEAAGRIGSVLRSSSDTIIAGAVVVFEAVAGVILAVVLAFFFIKDGRRFQRWGFEHLPRRHHELVGTLFRRAWSALGGYLRGAALIGLFEGVVLGLTVWLVGARLAVPVAVLTFVGAFFPIVGAVVAGVIATLVALVSGGVSAAAVVAVVALIVQQFDNDLLAPLVYGKMISLHPVVVLLSLAAGGTLGGIIGAFLAVPVVAVAAAVGNEIWSRYGELWLAAEPTGAGEPGAGRSPHTGDDGH